MNGGPLGPPFIIGEIKMAIKQQIAFEGITYNLDNRDRLAAHVAQDDSTGQCKLHKITGHALVDSDDSVVSWTQPANTLLTRIWVVVTSAPTISSGDIGYEVGTSSSGAQIVGTSTDTILDGGTTLAAGLGKEVALVAVGDASAGLHGSSASRTLYFNLIATTNASAQGEFMWIIETLDITSTSTNTGTVTAA